MALSGAGMFLLVFGIQEGHQYDWSTTIWLLIGSGVVIFGLFVLWQARNTREPLVPLSLFRERNFSLASVAISVMGFSITAMAIPIMLWAQVVRGLSPTRSALLLVPMAVMTILLAKPVGGLTDRAHPRLITGFGFSRHHRLAGLALVRDDPRHQIWALVPPMLLLGIGNAFIWAPNSATATRNLPLHQAGAGSGVYNATRQVGAVLGSAAIAVLIDARLAAEGLPAFTGTAESGGSLPTPLRGRRSATRWPPRCCCPPAVLVLGLVAVAAVRAAAPRGVRGQGIRGGFGIRGNAGAGSAAAASSG